MAAEVHGPDRPLVFLHIPRTAGTTLSRLLRQQFQETEIFIADSSGSASAGDQFAALPPSARRAARLLLVGHGEFSEHPAFPEQATFISLLRDPVQRVVSTYRFAQDNVVDPLHEPVVAGGMSLAEFAASGLSTMLNDWQVRCLAGEAPSAEPCRPEVLVRAKENIEHRFALIGLTEAFPETVAVLGRLFNWDGLHYAALNASRAEASLSSADVELIRKLNSLDCELYDYAAERLAQQVRSYAGIDRDLRRLARGNRLHAPLDGAYRLARRVAHVARRRAEAIELYGPSGGRDNAGRAADEVLEEAGAWQGRPLDRLYPILYLDAVMMKIREGQSLHDFACYVPVGVNLNGGREALGVWFQSSPGETFWPQVLGELRQRGVDDVLICCIDELPEIPEATPMRVVPAMIEAAYPGALCAVDLSRAWLQFVPDQHRSNLARDLKPILTAPDRDGAARELGRFARTWDATYPMISRRWTENWEQIAPFLELPLDLRRAVCATDANRALNRQILKMIKTTGSFRSEESARKLLYLAALRAQSRWGQAPHWSGARLALERRFGPRLPESARRTARPRPVRGRGG